MSERRWEQMNGGPSWTLETPVGRATVTQAVGQQDWTAQLEAPEGLRQSQPFRLRDEAESWVAQQVEDVQRASDVSPATS